ncbi:MAG: sugar ABC transporter permease [Rubellimicrobium sp.]|nr:sugar ABC transporter permease [Rubellimicrobium sp.]
MTEAAIGSPEWRRREARRQRRRGIVASYLFLTPYLVLLAMFGAFPIFYALGLSFTDTFEGEFGVLLNYEFVFSDFRVPRAVRNVATFAAIWVTMTLVGVTVLSLLLDSLPRRGATIVRSVYFLPGSVIASALVVLWLFVLDPTVSPFGPVLALAGWQTLQDVIFGLGYPVVFAIMAFFSASGGWIVVIGGALSGLPTEVKEAARVDGANGLQMALRIKLPLVWRSLVLMAILTFAAGLQIFVEPQLIGLAGHQFTQSDWSLNQLAFQYAFRMGDFGASAALSTMLVATSISIALVIVFVTRFYRID